MTQKNQRLPEEIYVRRRVAAVVALLVVIALIIWGLVALVGGGGEEEAPAPTNSTQAAETTQQPETSTPETSTSESAGSGTETTDSSTTESPTEGAASEMSPTGEPTSTGPTGTEEAKQSCTLGDLQITVTSDQPSYGPGSSPTFYMSVRNPTAVDCEIDLSQQAMRFEVYNLASNQRIWSDVDCNAPIGTGEETFEAGSERNFQAVWSRTTSGPDSCSNRQPVSPGGYFLHGVIGQNASNSYTFNLG